MRPNIFPALHYRDPDAALEWLKRAFGFEEKAVYRGDDGAIHHAELRLGDGLIMFGGVPAEVRAVDVEQIGDEFRMGSVCGELRGLGDDVVARVTQRTPQRRRRSSLPISRAALQPAAKAITEYLLLSMATILAQHVAARRLQ